MAHAPSPLDRLRAARQPISDALYERIAALGADAVEPLVDILRSQRGWPAVHAARLLADLGVPQAIRPMLERLAEAPFGDPVHEEITMCLPDFGADVLDPALDAYANSDNLDTRASIAFALSELPGIRDPRVFAVLADIFAHDPIEGAAHFQSYGDPAALPLLERAIDTFEPDFDSSDSRADFAALLRAHDELNGELPDVLHERVHDWIDRWKQHLAPPAPVVAQSKLGRNEPCPCGSGKKYKKCCLLQPST